MEAFSPERLREARLALGLTQAAFAAKIGVGERTLRRIEAGAVRPDSRDISAIAEATGKPIEWFFRRREF